MHMLQTYFCKLVSLFVVTQVVSVMFQAQKKARQRRPRKPPNEQQTSSQMAHLSDLEFKHLQSLFLKLIAIKESSTKVWSPILHSFNFLLRSMSGDGVSHEHV